MTLPDFTMTEADWLACVHPYGPLEFVKRRASNRQSRLFACACCRRIWSLIDLNPFREAVEVSEQYADGLVIGKVRKSLSKRLGASYRQSIRPAASRHAAYAALHCLQKDVGWHPTSHYAAVWAVAAATPEHARLRATELEHAGQAALLKDIFNPFRSLCLNPKWLTTTVVALAKGIYKDRAFDRMPILADALQDAGCDNEDVLNHCRDAHGVHVRGCWALDLVLGKS